MARLGGVEKRGPKVRNECMFVVSKSRLAISAVQLRNGKMSGIKLYKNTKSPVCRPAMLFLAVNNIPHELVDVDLAVGAGKNPGVAAIHPNKKVPCLDDNGFTMFESVAIIHYLASKYGSDHWYPKDLQIRAKIDEALAWFPGNLRCGLFPHAVILPKKTGQRDEKRIAELTGILKKSLDTIEDYFLKDKPFIGGDQISIADLQFVCQITQYWLIGKDVYKGRPNTERWVAACREYLAPYFDIVYKPVYDIAKAGTMTAELDL